MSIKVMLVDDHPVVRQGLRHMIELNRDIEIIAEASSGEEALERLGVVVPNIVLLDVRMPGMGGIEALRQLLGALCR